MKVLVVYKSKYGASAEYADRIAEALGCDLCEADEAPARIAEYDLLVYGGGLYAGRVSGLDKFLKKVGTKPVVLFTAGISQPHGKTRNEGFAALGAPAASLPRFDFVGRADMDKIKGPGKLILGMIVKAAGNKSESERSEEDRALLENMQNPQPSDIAPLVRYVQERIKSA